MLATTYDTTVSPTFDAESEHYQVRYDPDGASCICTTVVYALSALSGDEPTHMLPLNRAVDGDVLEAHVDGRTRGAELSFQHHGYDVSVRDDGQVTLSPQD